jgi:hypothetical protein
MQDFDFCVAGSIPALVTAMARSSMEDVSGF